MSEDEKVWAARIADWEASGESAAKYAEGRGYSGTALYYWRRRMKEAAVTAEKPAPMKIARVVRTPRPPAESLVPIPPPDRPIIVESTRLGIRVLLPVFDLSFVRGVVEALDSSDREAQQ